MDYHDRRDDVHTDRKIERERVVDRESEPSGGFSVLGWIILLIAIALAAGYFGYLAGLNAGKNNSNEIEDQSDQDLNGIFSSPEAGESASPEPSIGVGV